MHSKTFLNNFCLSKHLMLTELIRKTVFKDLQFKTILIRNKVCKQFNILVVVKSIYEKMV